MMERNDFYVSLRDTRKSISGADGDKRDKRVQR